MKFDIIIGNPPYHLSTGSTQATPIYQKFVQQAIALNPAYISMIIPSKWFAGGMASLDEFREQMTKDSHIKEIVDFANAKDCFPANSVGGGVCYFVWDSKWQGECTFTNVFNGERNTSVRRLDEFPVLVRFNEAVSILRKVMQMGEKKMYDLGSPLMPFGFSSDIRGEDAKTETNSIGLYASNGQTYINRGLVKKGLEYLDKYKVLLGILSAEHALEPDKDGKFRIITSSMKVIGPGTACTHSYFVVGPFETKEEAEHLYAYLKTKFARFLILLSMTSTHLSRNVFIFLPQQDFARAWTDSDLYQKYGLSQEEIDFIESMMKEAL